MRSEPDCWPWKGATPAEVIEVFNHRNHSGRPQKQVGDGESKSATDGRRRKPAMESMGRGSGREATNAEKAGGVEDGDLNDVYKQFKGLSFEDTVLPLLINSARSVALNSVQNHARARGSSHTPSHSLSCAPRAVLRVYPSSRPLSHVKNVIHLISSLH